MRYICSQHRKTQASSIYQYLIADSHYQSEVLLPQLGNPIIVEPADCSNFLSKTAEPFEGSLHFQQKVAIGNDLYAITLYKSSSAYVLEHEEKQYKITADGIRATLNVMDMTLFFGPAMMLNLALNRVYCVHASAFSIKNSTFIIMAASGTGKSTIAQFMHGLKDGQRIADDILPLAIMNGKLTLLPHFPQLKLAAGNQYNGAKINENIVLLFAQVQSNKTQLIPIDNLTGMKKLISHTVASKLFATDELEGHMQFCYQASQQCQHYLLNYQHDKASSLNQLYELLHDIC